jgi:hypothetical protein
MTRRLRREANFCFSTYQRGFVVLVGSGLVARGFLAVFVVLVLSAGSLLGANVVAADSVQVQSYQRDSQTAECPRSAVGDTVAVGMGS